MPDSHWWKFENDFVLAAIQLARHTGKTVKVLWTRDDDMRPRLVPPVVGPSHSSNGQRRRSTCLARARRFHAASQTELDGTTKVTAGVHVGVVLHPSGVRQQAEGAIMDAVTTTKGTRITATQGKVVQKSFADYWWARIGDTPGINVVVVASDVPVGGLGELAYPAVAAALGFLSRGNRTRICGSVVPY